MPTRRSHSTVDLALRRQGGLNGDGNHRVERTITARRKLAAREVACRREPLGRHKAFFVAETGDKGVEEPMATLRKEHDRAKRRQGAALAEQRRSSDRYDAAVGRCARLLAAVGLHAADQEVAARDAWVRWVDDDGFRGLNAGPFELLAEGSGP
jgi:hypothetical protein